MKLLTYLRHITARSSNTHTVTGKPKERDRPKPVSIANPYARSIDIPRSTTDHPAPTEPAKALREDAAGDDRAQPVDNVPQVRSGRTALLP